MAAARLTLPVTWTTDDVLSWTKNTDFASDSVSAASAADAAAAAEEMENSTLVYYPAIMQPTYMVVIYSLAYSLVFVVGVVGNSVVVAVVCRNPQMHNVTNYFIVNLAVADILVLLFCLPITLLSNIFSGWRFGAVMCKLTPYLQGVSVSASVNTLAAISFERYFAICQVLHFRMTGKMARTVIALIWIWSAAIIFPWLLAYQQIEQVTPLQTIYICSQIWPSEDWKKGFFIGVIFLFCYTIPLLLICVCYTFVACRVWFRKTPGVCSAARVIHQSKVKVLKMLIVVVILFASFWLPLYAVNVRVYFTDMDHMTPAEAELVFQTIIPVAQWLGSSNSCVNPIIYCLFSRKFRAGFRDVAPIGCPCWTTGRKRGGFGTSVSMHRGMSSGYGSTAAFASMVVARVNSTSPNRQYNNGEGMAIEMV